MKLIVQKYGGSSVADLQCLQHVATKINNAARTGNKIVVVTSAMGNQTNDLLKTVNQLSKDPPKRELDMLLTAGERISAALLSIALQKGGLKTVSLTGSQCGIITNSRHGDALIDEIRPFRLLEAIKNNDVVIVCGFQGVSKEQKDVTTLGRGGSDLTAVALAIALKADSCELYKDVPGICSFDPKMSAKSKTLESISYQVASQMAWLGAKVIHARCVDLAHKYQLKIRILNTFDPNIKGTLIEGEQNNMMESPVLLAVTLKEHLSIISCSRKGLGLVPSEKRDHLALATFWQSIQNSPSGHTTTVVFDSNLFEVDEFFADDTQPEALVTTEVSAVSLIGHGLKTLHEVISKDIWGLNPLIVDLQNTHVTVFCKRGDKNSVFEYFEKLFSDTQKPNQK